MICHLITRAEWEWVGDVYRPESLESEGFIHFSSPDQVAATAERHYAGVPDLLVVHVDETRFGDELRWEDGFPHLYAPLPRTAVVEVRPL
jgi:uncharacterized protein (DUF952 family)